MAGPRRHATDGPDSHDTSLDKAQHYVLARKAQDPFAFASVGKRLRFTSRSGPESPHLAMIAT